MDEQKVQVRQHQAVGALRGYLDGYIIEGPRAGLTAFLFEARPPWNERVITVRQWGMEGTLRMTLTEAKAFLQVLQKLVEEGGADGAPDP